jgi:hypothetical protein
LSLAQEMSCIRLYWMEKIIDKKQWWNAFDDWLLPRSIIHSVGWRDVRLDQSLQGKRHHPNISIFHWSDTEMSSSGNNKKSGIIVRFTASVRRIHRDLDSPWAIRMSFYFVVIWFTLLLWSHIKK